MCSFCKSGREADRQIDRPTFLCVYLSSCQSSICFDFSSHASSGSLAETEGSDLSRKVRETEGVLLALTVTSCIKRVPLKGNRKNSALKSGTREIRVLSSRIETHLEKQTDRHRYFINMRGLLITGRG